MSSSDIEEDSSEATQLPSTHFSIIPEGQDTFHNNGAQSTDTDEEDIEDGDSQGDEDGKGVASARHQPVSVFPFARVKKIMKADPELTKCAPESVHAVSIATERFVQLLTEASVEIAQREGRRTLKYDDVAAAVAQDERLQFLGDLIPSMTSLGEANAKKASQEASVLAGFKRSGAASAASDNFLNPSLQQQ